MGLFSFLKGAGNEDMAKKEAAEKARQAMDSANEAAQQSVLNSQRAIMLETIAKNQGINVEDLGISVDDDKVTITGRVDTQSDKEKIVLALGNVSGIAVVNDQMEAVSGSEESSFYEVKSGDSLSKIAKAYYGDPQKYDIIFEANKPLLSDPDLIYPGQTLRIPKV